MRPLELRSSTAERPSRLLAALTLAASLAAPGCFYNGVDITGLTKPYTAAMKDPREAADDQIVANVEKARATAKNNPGGVDEARLFAQAVANAYELGVVERKKLDGERLVAEATDALEAAAVAFPDQKPEAMFSKGGMLLAARKTEEGILALRASMAAKPSPRACVALIAELDKKGDPGKEIIPLCKKARPNVASDETRFALLDACITHSHAKGPDDGLKWAGKADVTFYKEYSLKLEAEAEQRRIEEEARRARQREEEEAERRRREDEQRRMASSGSGSGSGGSSQSSAPSGPSRWSVTLRNECKQTVKLFLGKKPKWGSGTYTSLGSNTISSYSGWEGEMIWIVDDGQNGLSSLSPSGNQRYKILSGCTGFSPD